MLQCAAARTWSREILEAQHLECSMGLAEQHCGQPAWRSSKNATPAHPPLPDQTAICCCSAPPCSCVGHCSPMKENAAELKEGDLVKM